MKLSAKISAIASAIALLGSLPAAAYVADIGEAYLEGSQVAVVPVDARTYASPSASPSDLGTVLVTWYGSAAETTCYQNTPEPTCKTIGAILSDSGEQIVAPFELADVAAPNYFGAPDAAWNPVSKEWVVYWTTYSTSVGNGESGTYLRRVSAEGLLLGDVYPVSSAIYYPNSDTVAYSTKNNVSPSLVWLPEEKNWLFVNYTSELGGAISYQIFDQELNPISRDVPTFLTESRGTNPWGVSAALDESDGSVLITYRDANRDIMVRDLIVSGNSLVVGQEVVAVSQSGSTDLSNASPGIAFVDSNQEFLVSWSSDTGPLRSTKIVSISTDHLPEIRGTVGTYPWPTVVSGINRSYVGFDSQTNIIYISQNVNTSVATAVYWKVDAASYSIIGEPIQLSQRFVDGVEVNRASQRPAMTQTGDNIAVAYMSWGSGGGWGSGDSFIMFASLTSYTNSEPEPIEYKGPYVSNVPQTAAAGSKVSYTGSNLRVVESIKVGGREVTGLVASSSTLSFTVPQLAAGTYNLEITFAGGEVSVQRALVVNGEPAVWTKRISNSQAKIYAKNVVGAGKVQFFLNGKEVAWVNAADSRDPKLSSANGFSYLVRTANLKDGKNVLEIKVDGDRLKRVVYSR